MRLKPFWNERSIFLIARIWLMCSLVTSIFLYACESWALKAELQRRTQAMETRYYASHKKTTLPTRKSAPRSNSLLDHMKTWLKEMHTEAVWTSPIHQLWPKPSCKAQWKGEEDKADRGRGGKTTSGMERPGVCQVQEGSGEQRKLEESGCEVICGAPTTPADKG